MTAADAYALTWLLAVAYAAELARLERRVADLEDAVRSARDRVEAEQDAQRAHALTCPQRRAIPLTDRATP